MRKVKRKVNNPKQNVQSYNKDKIKTVSSNHQIKDTNIQSKLTKEQYKKLLDQKKLKQQSNIEKHSSKEKETLNREQYQKLLTKEHSNTKDSQQNKVKKKLTKEQYQKLLEQKKALERKKALTNSKNNSLNISSKTSTKSNNKITREQYQKLVEKRMKNAESASTGKSNHLTREEYQKRIEQKKLHDTQMNLSILKTLSNDEKTLKKNHSSQIIAHEKRKATDNNKLDTTVQDIYNKKSSPTLESKKGRKLN